MAAAWLLAACGNNPSGSQTASVAQAAEGDPNRPSVRASDPVNDATGRPRDIAINIDLLLPNVGAGIDNATLGPESVKLYRGSDGAQVPGTANTSGGGDALVFQPAGLLDSQTEYIFEITDLLKDTTGAAFIPFAMTFTTGVTTRIGKDPSRRFDLVRTPVYQGPAISSLTFGPDGRLYAAALDGIIRRWRVRNNGTLTGFQQLALPQLSGRALIGLAFQPGTSDTLWITNNAAVYPEPAADFTGKVTRLKIGTGTAFTGTAEDYIVGLPRSPKDHMTNSLAFGPDGFLYLAQGSNTAMGAADPIWYNVSERLLSASVLRIDPGVTSNLPIDVRTERDDGQTPYSPTAPGAPVTLYATGVRNAYDLVWHSNGHLYTSANGSAAGGNTPASPNGQVPALAGVATQDDYLFDIVSGGYYGHPNPLRNQYVLNGGNPTPAADPAEVAGAGAAGYPVGIAPDPAWRGAVYNYGRNRSPNGSLEYQSASTFQGRLKGYLLSVEYSGGDDILALPVGTGAAPVDRNRVIQVASGLSDPVDVAENPTTGNLYVAQLVNGGREGGAIALLRPHVSTAIGELRTSSERKVFYALQNQPSTVQSVQLSNTGDGPVTVSSAVLSGADNANFTILNPPTFPLLLSPGDELDLQIRFQPSREGAHGAILTLNSNDEVSPVQEIRLRGLGAQGQGGDLEPSLQYIVDTFEIPLNVGDTSPSHPLMPPDSPLGDEVLIQRFVKAGTGVVSIEPLAVFNPEPAQNVPVSQIGWYPAGIPSGVKWVVSLPKGSGQSLQPPIAAGPIAAFDPGAEPFAMASWRPGFGPNVATQEDAFNSWDSSSGATQHHLRIYPLKAPDGTVVPNAYVAASEEGAGIWAYDYQDVVYIIRNVMPASQGALEPENMDGSPAPDRLVFQRMQVPNQGQGVKETSVLRLHNRGNANITVNSLSVSDLTKFRAVPRTSLPAVLPPGGSMDVAVYFHANFTSATPPHSEQGTLSIFSNAGGGPLNIKLGGFWQYFPEGDNEPTLQVLLRDVFGYGTLVVGPGQSLVRYGIYEAVGDEVLSPYWVRANPAAPVSIRQLAAFHTFPQPAQLYYYCRDHINNPFHGQVLVMESVGTDAQRLLPHKPSPTGGKLLGAADINIPSSCASGAIGFSVNGAEFSDPTLTNTGDWPCPAGMNCGQQGHHVRFWPVKTAAGAVVPHTYILGMDSSGVNYDYNDDVYLISNIAPAPQ